MKHIHKAFNRRKTEQCVALQPTCSREAFEGRVLKTMAPGQAGTKRWKDQFGDALLCVRYREHSAQGRRYTTVELIVEERGMPPRSGPDRLSDSTADPKLGVRIRAHELELRHAVKQAGAKWDPDVGLWFLPASEVRRLGLLDRVTSPGA
jgi:hypothetical protein